MITLDVSDNYSLCDGIVSDFQKCKKCPYFKGYSYDLEDDILVIDCTYWESVFKN